MNLITKYKVPIKTVSLLKKIGALADSDGYKAFIVGGTVRDIILAAGQLDIDIVVEGDAIKLGQALAKSLGASLTVHKKFGTCTLEAKDGLKIDLATARKEIYESAGALPAVNPSSIRDDLVRRDFTINAMAVSINKDDFGRMIDLCGGMKDLKAGRIKVLHDKSFIDDPTRIFRAVRFEQRFGFQIGGHTESLMEDAVESHMLEKLDKQRVRKEVLLIMREDDPMKVLERLGDFIHAKVLIRKVT